MKSKVKSMLIIFFGIKGIVLKEFVLATEQSILHTTVMFYSDCVKMCEDFDPSLTSFITKEFLT
jgi:hypothetical protein